MSIGGIIACILWAVLYLCISYWVLHHVDDPDSRQLWLLAFLLCMPLAMIFFLLAGIDYRTPAQLQRLHGKSLETFRRDIPAHLGGQLFPEGGEARVDARFRPLARLLRNCGDGNRVFTDNSFEIITLGTRKRELLLQDIKNARRYIHIEYFRFGNDSAGKEVRDLLYQKVQEGVEVRFLNNNLIGRNIPRSYFRDMQHHGMEVLPYTHIRYGFRTWLMRINSQNHRKIVVIDGKVAYTGGMNLNDNYFYKWRDTHLRIEGPVVARLQASFIDSWISCGGRFSHTLPYYFEPSIGLPSGPYRGKTLQIVTDAPEYPWPATQLAYQWILENARDYVYIQTPYFIPPQPFLSALKSAALRGVDVRVMLPRKVDTPLIGPANRSVYEECLRAGVRIFERNGQFIHSKTLVSDDGVCIIGASNLDMRSFAINNEVNTFIYDRETALDCKQIFLSDSADVLEWTLEAWQKARPWYEDLGGRCMRLVYRVL